MKRLLLALLAVLGLGASASAAPLVTQFTSSVNVVGIAAYLSQGEAVTFTGTGFGSAQGQVRLCNSPFLSGATCITQTVTAWSDTSVSITANVTGRSHGDRWYMIITDSSGTPDHSGTPVYVQVTVPTITNVTVAGGNLAAQDAVLTITGGSFLTRPDNHADSGKLATHWMDFNDDTSLCTSSYRNQDCGAATAWMTVSNSSPRTTITNDRFYRRTGGDGQQLGYIIASPGTGPWYVERMWVRRNPIWRNPPLSSSGQQYKMSRWHASNSQRNYYYLSHQFNDLQSAFEYYSPELVGACWRPYNVPSQGTNWEYWETFIRNGTDANSRDGESVLKINGNVVIDFWENYHHRDPGYETCTPVIGEYDWDGNNMNGEYHMGTSFASDMNGGFIDNDNIYYDNTPAAILVGDMPTYNANSGPGKGFEVQVPITWTNTTLTASLNRGRFTTLANKYLFVVDQYGFVNTTGFLITGDSVDTSSPTITVGPTAGSITQNSAVITWTTDEGATTQLYWGPTTSLGQQSTFDGTLDTAHSVTLSNLAAASTYYYRARSQDAGGLLTQSATQQFVTSPAPDSTPPVISNVQAVNPQQTTVTITWTTDEPATSRVNYGLTTAYGSSTTLSTTRVTSHSQAITGLTENTTYHYRVRSADQTGNEAVSSDGTFLTIASIDTTSPTISGLSVAPSFTSANLTWLTDENTRYAVTYGTDSADLNLSVVGATTSLTTSHDVTLTDLTNDTLYFYEVFVLDSYANLGRSGVLNFVTNRVPTTSTGRGAGRRSIPGPGMNLEEELLDQKGPPKKFK